jgi:hypothetical protein
MGTNEAAILEEGFSQKFGQISQKQLLFWIKLLTSQER